MKYRTNKLKPDAGMEMAVTFSMPAERNVEQSSAALLTFIAGVSRLVKETGAIWIKIRCEGIPEELEAPLAAALEQQPKRGRLELVVNNKPL